MSPRIDTWTVRWNGTAKELRKLGKTPIPVTGGTQPEEPTPTESKLWSGHIPNRVLVGYAVPNSGPRPLAVEAQGIIAQNVYERRTFVGSAISTATINDNIDKAESAGQGAAVPFISFKETFGSFKDGANNTKLNLLRDLAVTRRAAGKPIIVSINHEPMGDGVLEDWASDHIYISNYLAGWGTDASGNKTTYNAANDYRDILAWAMIPNGNAWGPKNFKAYEVGAMVPQKVIDTFRENKHLITPDFYDPNPPNNDLDAPGGYASTADRTHKKIQAFIDWGRARNIAAVGCGEFSCVDAAGMRLTMDVMFANRDIWTVSNYFNSFNNSRWEWRLIPQDYPAYNGTNDKGFVDQGGNVQTAARLALFRTFLNESVSAQYTGPVN